MVISMENKDILVDVLDLIDRLDASVKLYKIQVIAETLGKVSQDFKDSHTEIPWKILKACEISCLIIMDKITIDLFGARIKKSYQN